jgi:hypothetical protein
MCAAIAAGQCPICGNKAPRIVYDGSVLQGNCLRCGPILSLPVPNRLRTLSERDQIALLAWSDQVLPSDKPKLLNDEFLRSLETMRVPSVIQRANRLLFKMIELYPRPSISFDISTSPGDFLRAAHVRNVNELMFFVEYLAEQGLLWQQENRHSLCKITGKGFLYAEGLSPNLERDQAFVAMWFDESLEAIWKDGFEKAIGGVGWRPLRISGKEHINKICDEIVFEIRRSRFMIADFTGQRAGVYYEAGFATGLGIPVVFTCREGEQEKLHFDVRQYNSILWRDAGDLRDQLSKRIGAVIGQGPIL